MLSSPGRGGDARYLLPSLAVALAKATQGTGTLGTVGLGFISLKCGKFAHQK